MNYIVITLVAKKQKVDLKIPTCITGQELLGMLGEALRIDIAEDSKIQVEPLGRILDITSTLAVEGVAQGALLTLV